MAMHTVLSVFDGALEAYDRPFCAPTRGIGVRAFMDEVNRPGSPMASHASDYRLFHVAMFDDATGQFTNMPNGPVLVSQAVDLVK